MSRAGGPITHKAIAFALAALLSVATASVHAQRLEVTGLSPNGVQMKIVGHSGNWWHKRIAPVSGTCAAETSSQTGVLTGLSNATRHTWRAYSAAGCADSNRLADVSFWTPRSAWNATRTGWGLGMTVAKVGNNSTQPFFEVDIFPTTSATWTCANASHVRVYIPLGTGDLSNPAETLKLQTAMEMLDTAKLAKATGAPVNVWVDPSNVVASRCALLHLSLD